MEHILDVAAYVQVRSFRRRIGQKKALANALWLDVTDQFQRKLNLPEVVCVT